MGAYKNELTGKIDFNRVVYFKKDDSNDSNFDTLKKIDKTRKLANEIMKKYNDLNYTDSSKVAKVSNNLDEAVQKIESIKNQYTQMNNISNYSNSVNMSTHVSNKTLVKTNNNGPFSTHEYLDENVSNIQDERYGIDNAA